MTHGFGGPRGPFQLIGRQDRAADWTRIAVRSPDEALGLLRRRAPDPAEIAAIRRWWHAQGHHSPPTDAQLLADLAFALHDGRIGLATRPATAGASGAAGPAPDGEVEARDRPPRQPPPRPGRGPRPAPAAPAVPDPASQDTTTWVEFRLVDEETGAPIPGVDFRIELPGGEVRTQATDGAGLIRIDGVDPGACAIRRIEADTGPEVTNVS